MSNDWKSTIPRYEPHLLPSTLNHSSVAREASSFLTSQTYQKPVLATSNFKANILLMQKKKKFLAADAFADSIAQASCSTAHSELTCIIPSPPTMAFLMYFFLSTLTCSYSPTNKSIFSACWLYRHRTSSASVSCIFYICPSPSPNPYSILHSIMFLLLLIHGGACINCPRRRKLNLWFVDVVRYAISNCITNTTHIEVCII